jgi:hypothetical protein
MSIRRIRNLLRRSPALAATAAFVWGLAFQPQVALAIDVSAPITAEDGLIGCATCNTSSSTVAQNGVVIGTDGTRALSTVSVNGTATKKYLQQTSSGAPSFDQVAIGDLSSMTSSDLLGKVSDETGTGLLVFGTSPTITSPTISTSIDLPSGAVNSMSEIDTSIKQSSSGTNKIATFEGNANWNKCVRINTNGNLEAATSDCSTGSSVNALVAPKSQTKVSSGNTTVYMDAVGSIGTTDDLSTQTVVPAGTWGNLRCSASANGTSASVTVAKGTCGSALSTTSMPTVSLVTANTVTKDTSTTFTTTADQCINFKIVKTSFAATAFVTCVLERTANS